MVKLKKIMIVVGTIMLAVFLLLVCSVAGKGALAGLWDVPAKLNWKEKTTPLDPAVVRDLCMAFSLSSEDKRCQSESVVYAPEFFGIIKETFAPSKGPWMTFDEIQEKIGKYQYRFEPPVTQVDGVTYFVVGYDFRGDRVYPIGAFFYGDGKLWRLVADIGD